jgi:magnesium chelatase family protein
VRYRVIRARKIQQQRFNDHEGIHCNAQLTPALMRAHCSISSEGSQLLKNAMEKLGLSARAYDRILKVSRTIADLEDSAGILPHHLAEAINYRSLDRDSWAG